MHTSIMNVHLDAKPSGGGFIASFPYDFNNKERLKSVLGYEWDDKRRHWHSQGPEVLLDMERFGIKPETLTPSARLLAEQFRDELWKGLQIRSEPIFDDEYGYQNQGTNFLAANKRCILADDMGLGKSKQALDAAVMVSAKNILILAPKTLCFNWADEIELWQHKVLGGGR